MVTYDSITKQDPAGMNWLVKGHSDQPLPVALRFYIDGLPAGERTTDDGTFEFALAVYQELEVLDRSCQVPRFDVPKRLTLYWTGLAGALYYRIDELIGAVWTERARLPDFGGGHFTWLTGVLEDVTPYQFRIVPVADGELEYAAIPFAAEPVRRPDAPGGSYAYSAGTGKVTIGA